MTTTRDGEEGMMLKKGDDISLSKYGYSNS
jgi:hypothetical protein